MIDSGVHRPLLIAPRPSSIFIECLSSADHYFVPQSNAQSEGTGKLWARPGHSKRYSPLVCKSPNDQSQTRTVRALKQRKRANVQSIRVHQLHFVTGMPKVSTWRASFLFCFWCLLLSICARCFAGRSTINKAGAIHQTHLRDPGNQKITRNKEKEKLATSIY